MALKLSPQDRLRGILRADGWSPDRFGHFHKGDLRMKFKKLVCRLETKRHFPATDYSPAHSLWVHIGDSLYYGDLLAHRLPNGQLKFGRVLIGRPSGQPLESTATPPVRGLAAFEGCD